MKIKSADLRRFMWLEDLDGHQMMLRERLNEGALRGWIMDDHSFLLDDRADLFFGEDLLIIADCAANVGPLMEIVPEQFGVSHCDLTFEPGFGWWVTLPTSQHIWQDDEKARAPTKCAALLAALEAAP